MCFLPPISSKPRALRRLTSSRNFSRNLLTTFLTHRASLISQVLLIPISSVKKAINDFGIVLGENVDKGKKNNNLLVPLELKEKTVKIVGVYLSYCIQILEI